MFLSMPPQSPPPSPPPPCSPRTSPPRSAATRRDAAAPQRLLAGQQPGHQLCLAAVCLHPTVRQQLLEVLGPHLVQGLPSTAAEGTVRIAQGCGRSSTYVRRRSARQKDGEEGGRERAPAQPAPWTSGERRRAAAPPPPPQRKAGNMLRRPRTSLVSVGDGGEAPVGEEDPPAARRRKSAAE